MRSKLIAFAKYALSLLFWILVWEIAARIVNHSYFLPSVKETFVALGALVITKKFYFVVFLTVLRVLLGILIGIAAGGVLAFLSYKFELVRLFTAPLMTVIKTTPVATFIIILWIALSGDALAIFVSVLMVTPIIWQNLLNGFSSISRELSEVCQVYEFSLGTRVKYLVAPALMKYFVPAIITSIGLAWKAEIAAEIIAYTKNSIGYLINDAKSAYLSDTVFAWTIVIIAMSIILEKTTKFLVSRYKL